MTLVIQNIFPSQAANSENGSGVKKLGALVDYNDSDSDEGKLSHTYAEFNCLKCKSIMWNVFGSPENGSSDEDSLPPSKRLKTAVATDEAAEVSH